MLDAIVPILARLVSFDTQNPPRNIDQGGLFAYCIEELGPAFSCSVRDLGDGCLSLFATRGEPTLLFNVHIDTVPADPKWPRNPHELLVAGDRAVGLGAADIKGAAACLLAAARRTKGPLALLFSSDEEAGTSRVVRDFIEQKRPFRGVVVGEPTGCRAVLEHRGIVTAQATFSGLGGHASAPRALVDNAVHEAIRWSSRVLAFAEEANTRMKHGDLAGIRLNLGTFQGGTKANMIASEARLTLNMRPLPGQDPKALLAQVGALALDPARLQLEAQFIANPLVSRGNTLAQAIGMDVAPAVDFWTEAALFSDAGYDTLVYGPGDIREAHTAGEWVLLADLAQVYAAYVRIIDASSPNLS